MRPEDILQAQICRFLAVALPSTAWYCSIPNGAHLAGTAKQRASQMRKLRDTGLRVGAPDLFVVHNGRFFAIEVKTPTGRMRPDQLTASAMIYSAGAPYQVCRSLDDVEAFLYDNGVPLRASQLKAAA